MTHAPVKIVLSSSRDRVFIDAPNFETANHALYFVWKRQKHSDIYYEITFTDGHILQGSIDIEPKEFHAPHKNNILTWHLNTFWNNAAKTDKQYVPADLKEYAKNLVNNYQLN